MELKDRLKIARENAHMTVPQLAKIIGVTRQSVSLWENGTTKELTARNLVLLAHHTRVSPLWLVLEQGPMQSGRYVAADDPTSVPLQLSRAWHKLDATTREHLLALVVKLSTSQPHL